MIELASLIARFGLPAAAGAVILFVILKGELRFRYPRREEVGTPWQTRSTPPTSPARTA
jgi:hypothetical protein